MIQPAVTSSWCSSGSLRQGMPLSTWWARCQRVLYGTVQKRQGPLMHDVRRLAAVIGAPHVRMFGDGAQTVEHPRDGHPGRQPEHRVEPALATGGPEGCPDHEL